MIADEFQFSFGRFCTGVFLLLRQWRTIKRYNKFTGQIAVIADALERINLLLSSRSYPLQAGGDCYRLHGHRPDIRLYSSGLASGLLLRCDVEGIQRHAHVIVSDILHEFNGLIMTVQEIGLEAISAVLNQW